MSMTRFRAAAAAAMVVVATIAQAQIPTVPHYVGSSQYPYDGVNPITILTAHQKSGDWDRLHKYGLELIQSMAMIPPLAILLGNVDENYYNVVWQSTGADGKDVVNRVLIHKGLAAQDGLRLPGLDSDWPEPASTAEQPPFPAPTPIVNRKGAVLLDVLVTNAPARLSSVYVFTPTPSPLATQLPDVVSKLNVIGFLAAAAGTGDTASVIYVSVNQPNVMMRRATIQIRDAISTPVRLEALRHDAQKTLDSVLLRQARTSTCARSAAADMKAAIERTTLMDMACMRTATEGATDMDRVNCATTTRNAVDAAFTSAVGACTPETGSGFGFDPVTATEQEFKNLVVVGGAKVVSGTATLTNAPFTRVSYGLMGALLVGHPRLKEPRVKVENGKIVKAPMDHTMTMVVVNIHPSAYDAEWPAVSRSERFRFFAGGVLTPDFGATVGVGVGLVRGLSVNTGLALMASNKLKEDEHLDQPPVDNNDPFRLQLATAGFVGFGYVFK